MWYVAKEKDGLRKAYDTVLCIALLLTGLVLNGCGGGTLPVVQENTQKPPQGYLAPTVAGTSSSGISLVGSQTFAIDDERNTFSQSLQTIISNSPKPTLTGVINAGILNASSRGLLTLGVTANYNFFNNRQLTTYSAPLPTGYAVELAGQAGGLIQMPGNPVEPLVSTSQCPAAGPAQTYLFVTIPDALVAHVAGLPPYTWDPVAQTAYGSADISASGSTVTLANIHQFTLPSVGGTGAPADPSPSTVLGACGPTAYGNTVSIPGQVIVTDPGEAAVPTSQAIFGIGPTGLLVEDNGYIGPSGNNPAEYQTALGSGTGAVGLPKPAAALDMTTLVGKPYLGFAYGAGRFGATSSDPTGWSSHLVSFGDVSGCAALFPGANTSTSVYGGTFTNDDPSTSLDGFGTCNFAIDLGTQSSPGLYTQATIWIGATYPGNTIGTYSFPAVAIAGQLPGQLAIFLLGSDPQSNQPWMIDLLQSK